MFIPAASGKLCVCLLTLICQFCPFWDHALNETFQLSGTPVCLRMAPWTVVVKSVHGASLFLGLVGNGHLPGFFVLPVDPAAGTITGATVYACACGFWHAAFPALLIGPGIDAMVAIVAVLSWPRGVHAKN